ncbi:MAG: hypothetical protein AAFU60_08435 [Bacteroidota bacterium]
MPFQSIIDRFIETPRPLFLIDAAGAAVSAFLLGVVLVYFQPFFGIPLSTLYLLAVIPCFFMVYDLVGYFTNRNAHILLGRVARLNVFYCLLSLSMMFADYALITVWGWVYVLGEISIVLPLAWIEWQVVKGLRNPQERAYI